MDLNSYYKLAGYYLFLCVKKPVALRIVKDPDALGEVVSALINADLTHNGISNIDTWRGNKVKWAVFDYIRKKQSRSKYVNNDKIFKLESDFKKQPKIPTYNDNGIRDVENNDFIDYIFKSDILDKREKDFLSLRFIKGYTRREIIKLRKTSDVTISRVLSTAIKKLRVRYK